jgi:hypothetical protein
MKRALAVIVASGVLAACGQGNVFSLEVGQCFQDQSAATEVSDVEVVDCDDAHDNEVYGLFDLPDGDYPGAEAVQEAAVLGCYDRFEGFVGRDYESSRLDFGWLYPTSDSWDNGDREVICMLSELSGEQLIGSMKDSGA